MSLVKHDELDKVDLIHLSGSTFSIPVKWVV